MLILTYIKRSINMDQGKSREKNQETDTGNKNKMREDLNVNPCKKR
jgi:hypothetical protein